MSQWFEIRNAPKPNGEVIACWHNEKKEHELSFGVKNLTYVPDNEDDKRTFGRNDAGVIDGTLVHEITESEFDLLTELADIPRIISDGILNHLGILQWCHTEMSVMGEDSLTCRGNVYAKVVLKIWTPWL